MNEPTYLTNQLLIAMPAMGDPNFTQTVALICDHSSRGALGLILNKPLQIAPVESGILRYGCRTAFTSRPRATS
jgi:putative transcriptional regulator